MLVEVSIVEQRHQAALAMQARSAGGRGCSAVRVSGQSVHSWLAAYRDAGLAGLDSKSRWPDSTRRREHPRPGRRRPPSRLL